MTTSGLPDVRILVYHGAHGDEYYLANTHEKRAAARQHIFMRLDAAGCYDDDDKELVELARSGSCWAINSLLCQHCDREYERWSYEYALDCSR